MRIKIYWLNYKRPYLNPTLLISLTDLLLGKGAGNVKNLVFLKHCLLLIYEATRTFLYPGCIYFHPVFMVGIPFSRLKQRGVYPENRIYSGTWKFGRKYPCKPKQVASKVDYDRRGRRCFS